jgi:HPt (histidine-containing phosphotransfer) domain-containing protein
VARHGLAALMENGDALDGSALERLTRIGGEKLVTQMIMLFLQHGPERIEQAVTGYASGDMRAIEHAAHSLKSSAGNLGASRLQLAAAAVEEATESGMVLDLEGQLQTLRDEYGIAAAALENKLAELQ